MGMGLFQQKEAKIPAAHKIGAAISGSRMAGGKITDRRLLLINSPGSELAMFPQIA